MESAIKFVKTIGAARLGAMMVVSVILIGFFAFVIGRVSSPNMAVLYSDLTTQDSAAIVRELASQNIAHSMVGDGSTIQVPAEKIASVRMMLAEAGLPNGGSVGYEIFDNSSSFGSSSFVQNVNQLRAMEGELSRTISSLRNVAKARVHLAIPERQLFVREQREPTASIVLKVIGQMERSETRAIQHLVSSAVDGLKPSRVSVVDETGRLLASGSGEGEDVGGVAMLDERQSRMEARMRDRITEIVSSVVGPGRARVQLSVELDHDRITQQSDMFDPDGQVVRSTQIRNENNLINQPSGNGGVTVDNQLPGADQGDNQQLENEVLEREEETVNYEISKTTRTEVKEAGSITRLSVAVLVDGRYEKTADGFNYLPREQAELDQISLLVRSAVGFSEARGDAVEIVNLRFNQSPDAALLADGASAGLMGLSKPEIMRVAEYVVLFLMTIIVSLVALRPMVKRVLEPEVPPLLVETAVNEAGQPVGADGQPLAAATASGNGLSEQIEVAVKDGELQAETMAQVGQLISDKPDQAAAIVKSWSAEAA